MMNYFIIGAMLVGMITTASCQVINVKVMDSETEKPIKDATVMFTGRGGNPFTPTYAREEKITNKEGRTSITVAAGMNDVGIHASKNGYYTGFPKNEDIIRLRPVKEPVNPLIGVCDGKGNNAIKTEEFNKKIGFDFVIGDWVAPRGKGKTADVIFTVKTTLKDTTHPKIKSLKYKVHFGDITITFPGKYNGIITYPKVKEFPSYFPFSYEAPDTGYKESIKASHDFRIMNGSHTEINKSYDSNQNYIIRIRSQEKEGKLIDANYGAILGGVNFTAGHIDPQSLKLQKAWVYFKYYLNAESRTRNIECDVVNAKSNQPTTAH